MRLAVCQVSAALGDKAKNIATISRAVHTAACWGTDLVVLPELFLTGYNIGSRAAELAEAMDGPSLTAVAKIAARESCAICVGFAERDGKNVFNSSALFDTQGNLVALYRKIHLFGPKEQELFTAGDELVVARLGDCTIGMAICYDIEFPEFARALKRRGADLIVAPTANMLPFVEVPTTFVRARALENGLFLAYANHCGTEAELEYTGMSGISGPDGLDLARAGIRGEALLLAELPTTYPIGSLSTQSDDLRLSAEK
ncbi:MULTISPECIES: carbon-nitrogen hydrolase family protein [unclassified Hyphomicrobium]|uniref:carbon-nitrogen hydrolase family protein n=1 Tax=unclassified Hyphomicrobium TaxID=2619925 RepID=UPI000213F940|nr:MULTISPECIES: carbon-nitrogen hydrolase family protein [unclassified Hyphomicrobium]CCB63666.1 putative enzyme [Hyphomicrobium sp. MC1]